MAGALLPLTLPIRDDRDVSGRIYSIGYEGLSLDDMVDRLTSEHVSVLVDVRLNPSSRRPGFSKTKLSAALAAAGISYVHEKDLGNPKDNREAFRRGDAAARERMRSIVANGTVALDRIVAVASVSRIAVLCVEHDHHQCHREVIIDMAVERNPEIEVMHLS